MRKLDSLLFVHNGYAMVLHALEEERSQLATLKRQNNLFSCAHLELWHDGVMLADEYLGKCSYTSLAEFRQCEHMQYMLKAVVKEAALKLGDKAPCTGDAASYELDGEPVEIRQEDLQEVRDYLWIKRHIAESGQAKTNIKPERHKMHVLFKDVKIGQSFKFNSLQCIKKSQRTAWIDGCKREKWFYFGQKENCKVAA